jgi:hypothetical protein
VGHPPMAESERFIPKFVRDAVLTIIGGLVIEPTLRALKFNIGPHLRVIWMCIFGFLTMDALARSRRIKEWGFRKYHSLSTRNKAMSYLFVAMIGAASFAAYWFVISELITAEHPAKADERSESQKQSAKPLNIIATASSAGYPIGTVVSGITWSNRFTELRISFANPNSSDAQDLDIGVLPDQPIAAIAQVTNLQDVSFIPAEAEPVFQMEQIKQGTGERIKVPLKLVLTTGGYRVRCKTLPRNYNLDILIAIARAIDFPPPGGKPLASSVFDRNYAVKLGGDVDRWYGHGLFSTLYKADRVTAHKVKIEGLYTIENKRQSISSELDIKDIVNDVLRSGAIPQEHRPRKDKTQTQSVKPLHGLEPLTDAQRFALKKKLLSVNVIGSDVCIVRVGQKPAMNTIYEQLVDAFEGWTVSANEIGMVGVAGMNFPDGPYLTGPNINSPLITQVYSAFNSVGIDLPLVPDAFMGECKTQVVIVLH